MPRGNRRRLGWCRSTASIGAVAAALITVVYARSTVSEARQARDDARTAHAETLAEQRQAAEAFAVAHHEEMSRREQEFEAELRLQRVRQLERIGDALLEIVEVAQQEQVNPPPLVSPPMPIRATRIPALIIRLRIAVSTLERLGGPDLPTTRALATAGMSIGEMPVRFIGEAVSGLSELSGVMDGELLQLQAP